MPEVMRSRQWLSEWLSLLLNHLHVQHGGSFLLQPIGLHVTYCASHAPWARTFSDLIYAMAIPTCRGPNRVTVSVVYTSREAAEIQCQRYGTLRERCMLRTSSAGTDFRPLFTSLL